MQKDKIEERPRPTSVARKHSYWQGAAPAIRQSDIPDYAILNKQKDLWTHESKKPLDFSRGLNTFGAESRNRTGTPCGAGFWVQCVYQFRHLGNAQEELWQGASIFASIFEKLLLYFLVYFIPNPIKRPWLRPFLGILMGGCVRMEIARARKIKEAIWCCRSQCP